MNQHCEIYCELMNMADLINDQWNEILDHAYHLRANNQISEDEWYARLEEVTKLQFKYIELRDQAINADHIYWAGQYHIEEETDAEYRQRAIYDERP